MRGRVESVCVTSCYLFASACMRVAPGCFRWSEGEAGAAFVAGSHGTSGGVAVNFLFFHLFSKAGRKRARTLQRVALRKSLADSRHSAA